MFALGLTLLGVMVILQPFLVKMVNLSLPVDVMLGRLLNSYESVVRRYLLLGVERGNGPF